MPPDQAIVRLGTGSAPLVTASTPISVVHGIPAKELVMTATFFALFQVDICNMYFSKAADVPFAYLTLGWFVVFLFEMLMNFVMGIDYGANPGLGKLT